MQKTRGATPGFYRPAAAPGDPERLGRRSRHTRRADVDCSERRRAPSAGTARETTMTTSLEQLLQQRVARWTDRIADWDAFADARVDGYRRAQHRFIGPGASGKADGRFIAADHFTLSVMFVPPGQGNAAHTHEVEEVFFILRGKVKVFFEDESGRRVETVLGAWDCVSCPPHVVHGYENVDLEPAYLQVMLGKARPELMSYADSRLQARRDEHLKSTV
jgi:mannose-6-phosphate isomerase-like protein (cupin superfamily)